MLFFTRGKAAAILLTALVVCLFAVPNFFPERMVKTWPSWAQRHVVLGLDLQGGSQPLARGRHQCRAQGATAGHRRRCVARAARGAHSASPAAPSAATASKSTSPATPMSTTPRASCANCRSRWPALLGTTASARSKSPTPAALITLTPTDRGASPSASARRSINRSRSSSAASTNSALVEPTIQRQGTDRILVQVPGLQDPSGSEGDPRQDGEDRIPHGRSRR